MTGDREGATRDLTASLQRVFDKVSAQLCIFDRAMTVICANEAFCAFADSVVANTLSADGAEAHAGAAWGLLLVAAGDSATAIRAGVDEVKRGELPRFVLDYQTRIAGKLRCFTLRAEPCELAGVGGVLVEQTETTARRLLERRVLRATRAEGAEVLASGVAHDINNLLLVIDGYVDLISRGLGSDPTCAADREEISRAIKGASALTQQLLSMRPNATPGSTVSLNQVIKDLARLLCKLGGEDVTVELQLDDQVGRAQIEAPVVQHILSELVRNARDACTRGGRIVVSTHNLVVGDGSIELAKAIPHGHWLVMRVHDTGAGIDPVLLPRVFEQFFTTRVGDDEAGLGLWVVDELARRCQGHVRLTSVPGEGTTVDVYLPGLEAREGQLFANSLERAVPRATVLVVEDNTAVRDLLQRVLRGAGYHVLVASGPAEARAISEGTAQPIQLLLTDVVMSDLTGPLLAAELQRARPDLAVVLMSGYSGAACLQREGVAAGTVFLEKPFTASHVLQTVQQALDAARVSRPARR